MSKRGERGKGYGKDLRYDVVQLISFDNLLRLFSDGASVNGNHAFSASSCCEGGESMPVPQPTFKTMASRSRDGVCRLKEAYVLCLES